MVAVDALSIAAVLNKAGLAKNAATARDMLNAGSVKVDGVVVDRDFVFVPGRAYVCQAGKKAFARVTLRAE
ncbi:Tyrosine--tRNA ligase [compost metagenome]